MKLLYAEAKNFGSYKELEADFHEIGLALIYGATGSGKSTLQDVTSWVLFGVTAKDGNVDDVRSWTNTEEPTVGVVSLTIANMFIKVTRIRGTQSQNDLYWEESPYSMPLYGDNTTVFRGKDITETQSLLEKKLGVTKELYLTAAYYNEFSPTASFFTSPAKVRKQLFDSLANLELPLLISENLPPVKKETKKLNLEAITNHSKECGKLEAIKKNASQTQKSAESWDSKQAELIKSLKLKADGFEQETQNKLDSLRLKLTAFEADRASQLSSTADSIQAIIHQLGLHTDKCTACGEPSKAHAKLSSSLQSAEFAFENLENRINPYASQIEMAAKTENKYLDQLQVAEITQNPFLSQKDTLSSDVEECEKNIASYKTQIEESEYKLNCLNQLQKLSDLLRVQLLQSVLVQIEDSTNRYLSKYFDSEIKVKFELKESDKLEITLWKSGYECSYSQLSKGQRGLLKLCFAVSVMKGASDRAGVHFNTLLFDEALDGFDSDLKIKAYSLFCELEQNHENVFIIDHNIELQSLFSRKFEVILEGDESQIYEESFD